MHHGPLCLPPSATALNLAQEEEEEEKKRARMRGVVHHRPRPIVSWSRGQPHRAPSSALDLNDEVSVWKNRYILWIDGQNSGTLRLSVLDGGEARWLANTPRQPHRPFYLASKSSSRGQKKKACGASRDCRPPPPSAFSSCVLLRRRGREHEERPGREEGFIDKAKRKLQGQ
jgi:hypothetical protein